MKVKSLEHAKELAYQHLRITNVEESKLLIDDRYTKEFEWGYLFSYNSRQLVDGAKLTASEKMGLRLAGNLPILVDKVDGTTHDVGGVYVVLDVELEEYRKSKGYPPCVKFPLKEPIEGKSPIEQVQALFASNEIIQIQQGLELAQEKQLFDLVEFEEFLRQSQQSKYKSLEELILKHFAGNQVMVVYKESKLPTQTAIFADTKMLYFYEVEKIDSAYFNFPKIEEIEFHDCTIREIPNEIMGLNRLNQINITYSKLGWKARRTLLEMRKKGIFLEGEKEEILFLGWRSRFYPIRQIIKNSLSIIICLLFLSSCSNNHDTCYQQADFEICFPSKYKTEKSVNQTVLTTSNLGIEYLLIVKKDSTPQRNLVLSRV